MLSRPIGERGYRSAGCESTAGQSEAKADNEGKTALHSSGSHCHYRTELHLQGLSATLPSSQDGCNSPDGCTLPGSTQQRILVVLLKTSQTVVQHHGEGSANCISVGFMVRSPPFFDKWHGDRPEDPHW